MLSLLYRLVYQEDDIVKLINKGGELGNFFSLLFPTIDDSNKCFFAVNLEKNKGMYYIMSYTAVVTVRKEETRANPVATNIVLAYKGYNTKISAKLWHNDNMGKSSITRYVTKGSSHDDCSTIFELRTEDGMLFQVEIPGGRCATIGVSRHILNGGEFHGKNFKHRNKPHGKLTAEQFESLTIIPSTFIENAKRYNTGNGGSSICPHQRQKHQCKDCKGRKICEHDRVRSECYDCKLYLRYSNTAADELIANIRNKRTDSSMKVVLLQVLGKKVLQLAKSKQLSQLVSEYIEKFFALYNKYQSPRVVSITEPHTKQQLQLWVKAMEQKEKC
jgi:hypothetical protein